MDKGKGNRMSSVQIIGGVARSGHEDRKLGFYEGVTACLTILNNMDNMTVDKIRLYNLFMSLTPKNNS